jgi:hypothetical protein
MIYALDHSTVLRTRLIGEWHALMLFEYARNRAGRPFLKNERVAIPYWLLYLILTVFGTTFTLAAVVR